jgi:hypothetical protein
MMRCDIPLQQSSNFVATMVSPSLLIHQTSAQSEGSGDADEETLEKE